MKQRGFTLLEISIVLVIIGLILGGVLGGQSLIRSMRAKDVITLYEDLRTATVYFRQRYNHLPGDLPILSATDIPNVAVPATPGSGDNVVDGAINAGTGDATLGTEVAEAPWHLFNAGFIGKIDATTPAQRIRSAFGAVHIAGIATVEGLIPGYQAANPTAFNAVVFQNLPCDVVIEVDNKLDNGLPLAGRGMGTPCVGSSLQDSVVAWYALAL